MTALARLTGPRRRAAPAAAGPGAPDQPRWRARFGSRPSLASPWWRSIAAAVAGALACLVFPAPSLWWLAYVALVPLILLVRSAPTGRRAAVDGWFGGAGFMLAVHHWLLPSLSVFIVVLALLLGLLWAPWGWLVRRLLGGEPGTAQVLAGLVLVPAAWLMVELVRSWQYLGGPWGLLGASQWQVPVALRLASVGGVWLLSFLLVLVNTAIAELLVLRRARVLAAGSLAAVAVGGGAVWTLVPGPQTDGRVRVAVVQPGVIDGTTARFDRSARLTAELAGQRPDLVVWGESSVAFDLSDHPQVRARLAGLSREVGADLLVNVDAQHAGGKGIYKSSVLVGPDGPTGDRYDKMRLVPFGEYIPFRSVLGWAADVGRAAQVDRHRGTHQVVMDAGPVRIGPLICFETAFPDMSRHLADRGAQVLVAQSSTSTFQHSWAPAQHASLAALRAAESGRPMVHATLSGISAVYAADGSQVGPRLGTQSSTAHVYSVPLSSGETLYDRWGDWMVSVSVGMLLLAASYEGVRVVRLRRSAPGRR